MKITQLLLKGRFIAPLAFMIIDSLLIYFLMPYITTGCNSSSSPVANFSFTFQPIPYEEEDIIAPGRGAEQWHDQNRVKLPADTSTLKRLDKYYRFSWKDLELGMANMTGSYLTRK